MEYIIVLFGFPLVIAGASILFYLGMLRIPAIIREFISQAGE